MAPKLHIDYNPEDEYGIIGISCHLKDYRLMYFLNQQLNFGFRKIEDFNFIDLKSDMVCRHSIFSYDYEENKVSFYVVANRSKGGYVLPEQKQLDYLLIIQGVIDEEKTQSLVKHIKEIPSVLAVFQLNLAKSRNIQKFLNDFELFQIDLQKKESEQRKEMLKKIERKKK